MTPTSLPAPVTTTARPRWVVPALIGVGVLVAGGVAVAIIRR